MATTTAMKNGLATAYANLATHAILFTAAPVTTGAATSEVSGGTYARVSISWGAPSNGVVIGTATLNVPAGTTITHAGVASASTGATVLDTGALGASQNFATAGTYALTITATLT